MISILLSTYNGSKYIREQLNSILNQTYNDYTLYIRDDGSSDNTLSIINEFKNLYPNKITLVQDDFGNVGVKKSFRLLMQSTKSKYYLFADQDDIWELNKVETLVKIANKSGVLNKPYLLFSNMITFYENSNLEFDFFKKFKVNNKKIQKGLFQGTISGCLMLFNDKAKQASLKQNINSNMLHDWDVLMSTYLYGKIEVSKTPLIRHRIHDSNMVGENLRRSKLILFKDFVKYFCKSRSYRNIVLKDYFEYINLCFEDVVPSLRKEKELFTEEEISNLSYIQRKKWYLKHFNPFIYGRIEGLLILLTV